MPAAKDDSSALPGSYLKRRQPAQSALWFEPHPLVVLIAHSGRDAQKLPVGPAKSATDQYHLAHVIRGVCERSMKGFDDQELLAADRDGLLEVFFAGPVRYRSRRYGLWTVWQPYWSHPQNRSQLPSIR